MGKMRLCSVLRGERGALLGGHTPNKPLFMAMVQIWTFPPPCCWPWAAPQSRPHRARCPTPPLKAALTWSLGQQKLLALTWKVSQQGHGGETSLKSLMTPQASLSWGDWQSTVWKTRMLKALSEKVSAKVKLQTSRVTFKSIAPELSLRSFLI